MLPYTIYLASQINHWMFGTAISRSASEWMSWTKRDEELEALILKWRAASQDAAEELFASARDKVFRMGGVRAWKESAKKSRERWDDGEGSLENWGHDLDENERERRKAEMLDSLDIDIDSKVERDGGREDEEEDDDDEEVCYLSSAVLIIFGDMHSADYAVWRPC